MKEEILAFTKKHYYEIFLVMPLLLYIILLTYFPVLQVTGMSFDANGDEPGFSFGLTHYIEIFTHAQFFKAFFNTIFITVVGLSLEIALGIFVAIQFNKNIKFRGVFRAVYLIPLGIPTIVAAANMRFIFDTTGFIITFY